jgi:hypothetical protein
MALDRVVVTAVRYCTTMELDMTLPGSKCSKGDV